MRGLVFVLAVLGMGFSALLCSADVLQRVGDDCVARALQASDDARRKLLAQAVEAYRLAHRLEPWQPRHAFKMGHAYEIAASTLTPLSIDAQAAWTSAAACYAQAVLRRPADGDRKSTRLNSSHGSISYAVFCLKKKKKTENMKTKSNKHH